jgi:hypothetical protein
VVVICTISIAVMGLVRHSLGRKKYLPWGSCTSLLGSRMFRFVTVLSVTCHALWQQCNAVCSLHVIVRKYLPRGRFSILPGNTSRIVLLFSFVGECRCGWAGCGSAETKPAVANTQGCGSLLSATRYAVWQCNAVCSLHVIVCMRFDSVYKCKILLIPP